MRRRWLAMPWLLLGLHTAAAEEPQVVLPEVVITATRTQTRVDELPSSITVIRDSDIAQRADGTATDALRGTPGVDVIEFGSPGHGSFASIRGTAPDQVLVLLDGVEVNAPTVGQFDFTNLTTDNVDRIEVLRGGGGTLYGSEAIGGVVNVITRRGEGPFRLSASGEAGSAATHREVVGVSGARGPVGLSGTASFLASDGFRSLNDDYRNFTTVWRADADLLPGATLRGFLRYTNARAGLVNFNVAEDRLDPDARSRSDFLLAKGEWEHALTAALTYRAAASIVRDNQRFRDDEIEAGEVEPVVIARFPSDILAAETQWDYLWRELALTTAGVEFKERSARIFKLERDDKEIETEEFNANRSNVGAYAQEQLRLLDDTLHGVGGVRFDHSDSFGDQVTWSGSGSYLIRPTHTRVRAGYAEGFRAPTFDELFEPGLGNPDLQAERSWEINAGVTQELYDGRLRVEPTYFHRRVTNLIEEVADQLPGPVAGVPEGLGTRNVNARFDGAELITRAQPLRWLTLRGTYTFLHFDAETLLNRPQHRGSFVATAERSGVLAPGDRGTLAVLVHAVGSRDSANPRKGFAAEGIGGYARTDLALSYGFASTLAPLTATATVRNLFDRDYSESIGFPAPPARFVIGLRYQL